MTNPRNPATYTEGLGEILRANRLYIGLSQRDMAERVGKDRRDYQRIEAGRDACPPGLLGQVEQLADDFAVMVDVVIAAAATHAATNHTPFPVSVKCDGSPGDEWNRLVAGRAAVETPDYAPIRLMVEASADQKTA